MSGVGKSTLGRALAKHLDYEFVDTDSLLLDRLGCSLQEFIIREGDDVFTQIEEEVILSLSNDAFCVIATGGSVIYSDAAMAYLRTFSLIIFLEDTLTHIQSRVLDVDNRGIVGLQNRSIEVLFNERQSLYKRYAHKTIRVIFPFRKHAMISRLLQHLKGVIRV
jgi:shikimate kinase